METPRKSAKRALLVLVLMAGCLDNGLMIGDGGDPDGATPDSGRDAEAPDAVSDRDAEVDSGSGSLTDGCPAPWLYYVSTVPGAWS